VAVVLAAAAVALTAGAAPAPADDCAGQAPGAGATFAYTGAVQHVRTPEGVSQMAVEVLGGHGGVKADSAPGGAGGLLTATLPVVGGECLDVYVGQYGVDDGGWGWGFGGNMGASLGGFNGGGGGGASAIVRAGAALAVAGGGGGGGGDGRYEFGGTGFPGGAGGAGAGRTGPGDWTGQDGQDAPDESDVAGGQGGWGHDGRNGGSGEHAGAGFDGGGGGGGGGAYGGQGGASYYGDYQTYSFVGGGGGGGGSSAAGSTATDVVASIANQPCPVDGSPACDGTVTLTWVLHPARVVSYGGGGQATPITSRFPRPLQARVVAANGAGVAGVPVTFALPASGASGRFDDVAGGTTSTATTNTDGLATAPPIRAGDTAGGWSATATVADLDAPARFALHNDPARTATALAASAAPSVAGEPVRFAATVAALPSSAPPPSGSVRFTVDGQYVPPAVELDSSGVGVSDPMTLPVGNHVVRAFFVSGDGDEDPSSASITQRVERAQATVELTSPDNPSEAGEPVPFTAVVDAAAPGTGTPTGTVRFELDGDPLGDPVPLAAGSATSPATGLSDGPHVVEASYSGDGDFASAGATLEQTVGAAATATEVGSSAAPSSYGEPVTIAATVSSPAGEPVGSADFSLDGAAVCTAVTLEGAQAECTLPETTAAGDHLVTVAYTPSSPTFTASHGRAVQRVIPARTTLGVLATGNPSVFGESYTLHADVGVLGPGAGTPTGSVQFRVDGAAVGSPVVVGADGATSGSLAPLPAGVHVVGAVWGGDANFAPSAATAPYVVDRAQSTASVYSSADPSPAGTAVTFVADVDLIAPGAGSAGGAVQFRVDGVDRGDPVPVSNGSASSAPVTGLTPGEHDVRASYLGDGDSEPSEATMVQSVSTGGPPLLPIGPIPPFPPRASVSPPLCHRPVVLTGVRPRGGRVLLTGVARRDYLGRRVSIVSRGRWVTQATVRRNGSFHARAPRPSGRHWGRSPYHARVAGLRSPTVRLIPDVRIVSRRNLPDGRVRLRAKVTGGGPATVAVVRQRGCHAGTARRVGRVRAGRAGRLTVVLEAPPRGSASTVYRLRTAGGPSRPVVVAPRR